MIPKSGSIGSRTVQTGWDGRGQPAALDLPEGACGVLPEQYLHQAIDIGIITAGRFAMPHDGVQPASVDLRLGERAFRIQASFLPGGESVERRLKTLQWSEIPLKGQGALLERRCTYLIELKEWLDLPAGIRAKANPKSSTGRVDVFTRVITDGSYHFDEIANGYKGPLYLEVVPLSFGIRVSEDLSLNQLRLSAGRATLSDDEIREEHRTRPILFRNGVAVAAEELPLAGGLFLSLDLADSNDGLIGYRARDDAPVLDLTLPGAVYAEPYWESVHRGENDRLILGPEKFHLLMSEEAVSIPPSLASEMIAFDPTSGELRTHYAGFFDPGFGYSTSGDLQGAKAALEVRAHDVPFMVEHGQRVCKLTFERMVAEPEMLYGRDVGSSYQGQTDALSKHFLTPRRGVRARTRRDEHDDQRLF
jgi:dCTP deaminase